MLSEKPWGVSCLVIWLLAACATVARADDAADVATAMKACEAKDAESCYGIANAYDQALGGLPQDTAKHREYLGRSCEYGYMEACHDAGEIYKNVAGRDQELALKFLEKACEGGKRPDDCFDAGDIWVKKDFNAPDDMGEVQRLERTVVLYESACSGSKRSFRCDNLPPWYASLGRSYANGTDGASKDGKRALPWLSKACAGGETQACEEHKSVISSLGGRKQRPADSGDPSREQRSR